MTCVLECDKCYHLQETAPDAAYCAHMHVNPCYRGLHKEPKVITPKRIQLPALPPKTESKHIPPFRPMKRSNFDWEKHHEYVFKMHYEGRSARSIALAIGVNASTVWSYIDKYRRDRQ